MSYLSEEKNNKTRWIGFNADGMYLLLGTTVEKKFGKYIKYFGAFVSDDDALLDGAKENYAVFLNITELRLKMVIEDTTVTIELPVVRYEDDRNILLKVGQLVVHNETVDELYQTIEETTTTQWANDWGNLSKVFSILDLSYYCLPSDIPLDTRLVVTDYNFTPLGTENIHIADSNLMNTGETERIGEWLDGKTEIDKRIRPIQFGIMFMSDVNASNNAVKVGAIKEISTEPAI